MVLVRGLVAPWWAAIVVFLTLGGVLFLPLWDRYNRTIIDLASSCWVILDPDDAYRSDTGAL